MSKFRRTIAALAVIILTLTLCSCKKAELKETYPKEDAGATGYGATVKSSLYIDDFYFLTMGTVKSKVELLLGNAHYCKDNNELSPVYTLSNGDSIAITYDEREQDVKNAVYTYSDGTSENFFNILVSLGILASSNQESGGEQTTVTPGVDTEYTPPTETTPDDSKEPETKPDDKPEVIPEKEHTAVQGGYFATGMYNLVLIEPVLLLNMQRENVLAAVGKPNYYYSHTFASNTYIIDCYNLNDGSKLYVDYGFARENLRCAAVYKNGTYTSIVGNWSEQGRPSGFTRFGVEKSKITSLSKNMTPAMVYKKLGEPSWLEGNRGNYKDVFMLTDGSLAYLNFGSAHNKLTSASIKGADGSETVIILK